MCIRDSGKRTARTWTAGGRRVARRPEIARAVARGRAREQHHRGGTCRRRLGAVPSGNVFAPDIVGLGLGLRRHRRLNRPAVRVGRRGRSAARLLAQAGDQAILWPAMKCALSFISKKILLGKEKTECIKI